MRSRRPASVVAATGVVTTCATRALVEVAFAGSAGTMVFATTINATATTTTTATRPASGTLATITLGTLLLAVAHRRRD